MAYLHVMQPVRTLGLFDRDLFVAFSISIYLKCRHRMRGGRDALSTMGEFRVQSSDGATAEPTMTSASTPLRLTPKARQPGALVSLRQAFPPASSSLQDLSAGALGFVPVKILVPECITGLKVVKTRSCEN